MLHDINVDDIVDAKLNTRVVAYKDKHFMNTKGRSLSKVESAGYVDSANTDDLPF
jgi:hypothetical protein